MYRYKIAVQGSHTALTLFSMPASVSNSFRRWSATISRAASHSIMALRRTLQTWVRRSEERGSKSTLLPPASPTEPQGLASTVIGSLAGMRVVICEDEGITQLQLKRILTLAGLKVVGVAGDGQAGVETVLRERPDLVLMDIKMPVMDGLEAARQIMAAYTGVHCDAHRLCDR